ncbi:MAG: hypothetical protein GY805_03485 [Chloroflexi bacterium]|nr:hypothetical protein [Chloroflexota bacterium]
MPHFLSRHGTEALQSIEDPIGSLGNDAGKLGRKSGCARVIQTGEHESKI